jgi:dethiobiotin synthetase
LPRIVVLGCGTGVGKTRLSVSLLRKLDAFGQLAVGLKPIESGVQAAHEGRAMTDAAVLANASSRGILTPEPPYALRDPVSPHLAARTQGVEIDPKVAVLWVQNVERELTPLVSSDMALWSVVETAGGVFSPLTVGCSNFDLALALEPAVWVLVAADALGVLHDVSACLQAMRARGRSPDHVVLSAAREPDASTGSNAKELEMLGLVTPTAVLNRNDDSGVQALVHQLLQSAR